MDIGTGKDLNEYFKNNIHYHLIDFVNPNDEYNLFRFTKDFHSAFNLIKSKNKIPILVGGTGLYLSAVLQSYHLPAMDKNQPNDLSSMSLEELKLILFELKPNQHNITDLASKERIIQAIQIERSRNNIKDNFPTLNSLTIGIKLSRDEIKRRITQRLKRRLEEGMIDEVNKLLSEGLSKDKLNFFGLEYKYVNQYIQGQINYNDMFQKLNSAIHSFAKRQMTWFRKMEREGVKINWFSPEDYQGIKKFVKYSISNAG
jgi:tRNA dimethylallyltransferase